MNKNQRLWISVAFGCCPLLSGCASHIRTYRVTVESAGKAVLNPNLGEHREGLVYALPKTLVQAQVPLKKTSRQAGDLLPVMRCFYPHLDPSKFGPSTEYSLGEPVLSTRGVADPAALFLIAGKGKLWEDQTLDITLNGDLIPSKIDAKVVDRRGDIALQVISSAANLMEASLDSGASGDGGTDSGKRSGAKDCESVVAKYEEIDKSVCFSICKAYTAEKDTTGKKIHDAESFAFLLGEGNRAFVAIKQLENRFEIVHNLLQGQALPEVVEQGFAQLDRQEKTWRARFFGNVRESAEDLGFELDPGKCSGTCHLFKWQAGKGLCSVNDSLPVRLLTSANVPSGQNCDAPESVGLTPAQIDEIPFGAIQGQLAPSTQAATGLVYRIPGKAMLKLTSTSSTVAGGAAQTEVLKTAPVFVAQFGVLAAMPTSTGGRMTQYTMEYLNDLGAVKSLHVGSEAALDSTDIEALESAATTVMEARDKNKAARAQKKKEEAAAASELGQLKEENELLAEKLKLAKLKKDLADLGIVVDQP